MPPTTLTIDTPTPTPEWALLQRELVRAKTDACRAFFDRYFDERGYLEEVPRWGGNDGPDDAIENLTDWPVLHALGASDDVLDMYKTAWEGHLRQYTEAKTVEVPLGRDGMYYREFPVTFDWLHNGESMSVYGLQGLGDPYDSEFRRRARRYAGLYMDEDPLAPNYDPEHKVIRSMFNGSRGPLMRKATALDWAGDYIEVEGRFKPGHGERSYQEMLDHFKDYTDVAGDHPMNMGATSMVLNAFMSNGESKYRAWLVDYIGAWRDRTFANGGVIPSNVGLDGTIGGECGGKWYGGTYGWGFTVVVPQTGELSHRPFFIGRYHLGFGNALLVTGDQSYVDAVRRTIDAVNGNAKEIDGRKMYPRMFGDEGWYDFRPEPFSEGALDVYYWSMDPADRDRVPVDPWLTFLEGGDPEFPVREMRRELDDVRAKAKGVREDMSTPDTRMSDDPMGFNPGRVGILVQTMLGGLPTTNAAYPMHSRLRFFDPARRRAGVPEDVAALVDRLTAEEASVTLVNLDPVDERTVIIQGGAYAEHQLLTAEASGSTRQIDDSSFAVRLAPGCGGRVTLKIDRYANQPTLDFPWA